MKLLKLLFLSTFILSIPIHASAFPLAENYQSRLDYINTSLNTGQELVIAPSLIPFSPKTLKFIAIFLCGSMFGGAIGLLAGGIVAGGGSFKTMSNYDKEKGLAS